MAKSKNSKKMTPEEIQEMEEFSKWYRQFLKANGVKVVNKNSKKYKAERGLILKLKATAAVMLVSMGTIQLMSQEAWAANVREEREIYTLASIVPSNEQQTAKIQTEGTEIELDGGSIAIVQGQIEEGENNVVAYDQDGNMLKGNVSSENLRGAIEISEEDLEDYIIYQVVSPEGADLIQTGEEVSSVAYGDFVLGKEQHDEEVDVIYPSEDGILRGEIDEKALEVVNELTTDQYRDPSLVQMVVDTSTDEYARLNFRSSPNYEKYSIMMQIPNGTIIDSTGETIIAEGREWTKIEYEGQTGWVASEYLKEFIRQEQLHKQEEQQVQEEYVGEREYFVNPTITNMSGGVTIIDVSTMNAKQLRTLLQNGIPSNLPTDYSGSFNAQGVAGKINGVLIKLGASSYGKGKFQQSDYDAYKELVAVCEELEVPYGFYYYSTSTDMEQAKIEVEYVENAIEELKEEFDMDYNKLPFAWDRELTGTSDRQFGKDVTDLVAYQVNRLQADGISEKVLLYMPGRIADENDSDRIIDLEALKAGLENPEDFAIWLCAPATRDGNQTRSSAEYIDMIENKYQISVANEQRYLDVNSPTGGKMDVNSMDLEYYNELTGEKENDVVTDQAEVEEDER